MCGETVAGELKNPDGDDQDRHYGDNYIGLELIITIADREVAEPPGTHHPGHR